MAAGQMTESKARSCGADTVGPNEAESANQTPQSSPRYEGSLFLFDHYPLTRYAVTGASTVEIMGRGAHASWSAAMRYPRAVGRRRASQRALKGFRGGNYVPA